MRTDLQHADALDYLRSLPDASVDLLLTDPPYAEVSRAYGRLTEDQWFALMKPLVREARRVLTPKGSALFVVQPNSARVGRLRTWVWEFQLWAAREWNVVQDAYWWNYTALPTGVCTPRERGLLRASVKPLVWLGNPDCYRDQASVLLDPSAGTTKQGESVHRRLRLSFPSGQGMNHAQMFDAVAERGGVTPFNLLPLSNTDSQQSAAAYGHGAGTPSALCRWWIRYLCPPGGLVCDPFMGSGTAALAALTEGRRACGSERDATYYRIACDRVAEAEAA